MGSPIGTSDRNVSLQMDQLDFILGGMQPQTVRPSDLSHDDWLAILEAKINRLEAHLHYLATVNQEEFWRSLGNQYSALKRKPFLYCDSTVSGSSRLLPASLVFVTFLPMPMTSLTGFTLTQTGDLVRVEVKEAEKNAECRLHVWNLLSFIHAAEDGYQLLAFVTSLEEKLLGLASKRAKRANETISAIESERTVTARIK